MLGEEERGMHSGFGLGFITWKCSNDDNWEKASVVVESTVRVKRHFKDIERKTLMLSIKDLIKQVI